MLCPLAHGFTPTPRAIEMASPIQTSTGLGVGALHSQSGVAQPFTKARLWEDAEHTHDLIHKPPGLRPVAASRLHRQRLCRLWKQLLFRKPVEQLGPLVLLARAAMETLMWFCALWPNVLQKKIPTPLISFKLDWLTPPHRVAFAHYPFQPVFWISKLLTV